MLRQSMVGVITYLMMAQASLASDAGSWTDRSSNPENIGWMKGFPPSPEKRIMLPDSDFFSFPKLRWSVCHIRELLPTKQIAKGSNPVIPLEYDLRMNEIDQVQFLPLGSNQPMSWKASLEANFTDGLLVIHKNKVVYEYYNGCLRETGKHAAMSMTKSLVGLMAEILVVEGVLDEAKLVGEIIPDLAETAYGTATVRQVMDMTTDIEFSEDYADPKADIWVYSAAASPWPKSLDYKGPVGYYDYLKLVKGREEHGKAFGYRTINTDVLGWIISEVTGVGLTQLISERLWQKIGAEQDAYMTVDGVGTPFAGGGLSAGLRDLGRLGMVMLNDGALASGETVLPAKVVENIRLGGSKAAFAQAGYKTLTGGSYKSMWWVFHNKNNAFAARGVHGQTIYIDPTAEMVIVRFASFPQAKNAAIDPTSLPAYEALSTFFQRQ